MLNRTSLPEKLLLWCTPLIFLVWNIIGISQNSVAGDEPFSLYFSEQSFSKIFKELFSGNNPPLYETILHCFALIFGHSIFALRTLSLLFITLAVGISVKTLINHFSTRHALVFAVLAIGSNFLLKFSHEIRGYGLLLFLISLSNYAYLQRFSGNNKKWSIVLLLANTLLLYTHYLSVFIIFTQLVVVGLEARKNKQKLFNFIKIHFFGLPLLAPLIYFFIQRLLLTNGGKTWLTPPSGLVDLYNMLWKFCNKPVPTILVILLFLLTLILYFIRVKKTPQLKHIYLGFRSILLLLLIFVLSFKTPLFLDRYLNVVILSFYLFISHCVVLSFKNKSYYIAFSLLGLSFLITKQSYVPNQRPLDQVHQQIVELRDKQQRIIVSDPQLLPALAYYFNEPCFFNTTVHTSEFQQNDCLIEYNIQIRANLSLEELANQEVILLEGGEVFQNQELRDYLYSSPQVSQYFIPEIFKIYHLRKEKNKSETQ